ncbi:MAG: neutral zinc metallopeptidase [Pseudomonadota bacterium]
MRWRSGRRSQNVEDRRGSAVSRRGKVGGGGLGVIVLALIAMYFGVDPRVVMQGAEILNNTGGGQVQTQSQPLPAGQEEAAAFTSVVLGDTEDTWNQLFPREFNRNYKEPTLVLFSGSVKSACGFAQSAMGPFYCPGDQKVYIDLSFFDDLKNRFGAPGDFAQAYVIAHEVGHHIQTLLGISKQVMAQRQRVSEEQGNVLSVRQELQADCLAGVWAHNAHKARNILESGDIEEGLNAATAIGDDRIQKQSRGYITPESFTHGSSEQRVRWFKRGLEAGTADNCDTFSARQL